MTTLLIAALLISLVVTGATRIVDWLGGDGGPRRTPLPRTQDGWSLNPPSRPYALS